MVVLLQKKQSELVDIFLNTWSSQGAYVAEKIPMGFL